MTKGLGLNKAKDGNENSGRRVQKKGEGKKRGRKGPDADREQVFLSE